MGKILRRCSLCGKFHASLLVTDPKGGKAYYCFSCWESTTGARARATQAAQSAPGDSPQEEGERHLHNRDHRG